MDWSKLKIKIKKGLTWPIFTLNMLSSDFKIAWKKKLKCQRILKYSFKIAW
jgi:hypothetical protein